MIRLILDEDMPDLLARVLRERGRDAIHVREALRGGWDDIDVFTWGAQDGRAIATHNIKNFRRLGSAHTASGELHHGLLLGPQLPFRDLLRRMLALLRRYDEVDVTNTEMWF